jgi:hypothetical protein
VCALILEVIEIMITTERFLRGAAIDKTKIANIDARDAIQKALPIHYLILSVATFICWTNQFLLIHDWLSAKV